MFRSLKQSTFISNKGNVQTSYESKLSSVNRELSIRNYPTVDSPRMHSDLVGKKVVNGAAAEITF